MHIAGTQLLNAIRREYAFLSHAGLLFLLVIFPNFAVAWSLSTYSDPYNLFFFFLFAVITTAAPLLLVGTVRHFFLFHSPFALFAPLYAGYVYLFRSGPSEGVIAAAIGTNFREVLDLVNVYGWFSSIPLLALCCYVYISLNSRHLDKKISSRVKKNYLLCLCCYVLVNVTHLFYLGVHFDIRPIVSETMLRDSYPVGVALTLKEAATREQSAPDRNFRFGAFKKEAAAGKEIHVLIIGESSRYQNWSVNGYSRETSPNLSRLNEQGDLISFADMAASSNSTIMTVPIIVTRATPANFEPARTEGSIAVAFREAGFKTGWISNQDNMYPPDADFSDFRHDWNYRRHDENMLPLVEQAIRQNGEKIFLVIHTMGNHVDYDQRYPKRFKRYTPTLADLDQPVSENNRAALVNSYDNSILATDDFIARVISLVDAHGAISTVFFISDHGENLFDDERALFMHAGANPSRHEIHIPAFVWASAQYRTRHPEKYQSLVNHRAKKTSQIHIFHTLLDLANIGLPDEVESMSIASKNFASPVSRLVLNQHWRTEVYEELK